MIRVDIWTERRKSNAIKMVTERVDLAIKDLNNNLTLHPLVKVPAMIGFISTLPSALTHIRHRPFIEVAAGPYRFDYRLPFSFSFYRFQTVSINYSKASGGKVELKH